MTLRNKHIMIDIESLDTEPGAAVTSIGAVEFDPELTGEKMYGSFHERASLESAIDTGTVSASTLRFWLDQGDEAKKELLNGTQSVYAMMHSFFQFVCDVGYRTRAHEHLYVWSNGARFDMGLLAVQFQKAGLKLPWAYNRELDVRTVVWQAGAFLGLERPKTTGIAHNALEDAKHQAKYVEDFLRSIHKK